MLEQYPTTVQNAALDRILEALEALPTPEDTCMNGIHGEGPSELDSDGQ